MEKIKFGTDGWRAIIAEDFTFANVRLVSRALANHIRRGDHRDKPMLVAYDNRFMAADFARQVAGVLTAAGIKVLLTETAVPTPAAAYAVWKLKIAGAVMLTASHNPPQYMGIKFIPHYAGPAMPEDTDAIMAELRQAPPGEEVPFAELTDVPHLVETLDIKGDYLRHLETLVDKAKVTSSNVKIVVDPMHGAGAGYIEEFLKDSPGLTVIRGTRDPLFGGGLPDPSRKYLDLLVATIKKTGSTLGVALDGDADRLGVVDGEGNYYSPNQILTLFMHYLIRFKGFTGSVARTVATTHMLDRIAEARGLDVLETPVGFKYIGKALREGAFLGGEESGGVSIRGHMPEKDGIMAALLFAEMLVVTKKTPAELLGEIRGEYGVLESRRLDLSCREEEKPAIVEKLAHWEPQQLGGQKVRTVNRIDGVKILLQDSWCLVRASGTEAVFRVYLEAPDAGVLNGLEEDVKKELGI